jgi:acetyl/propionyl-CoA carboxylase alpha subunit
MITTILVANRGEIARRVFRTCREMGIATVAVYSEADAAALHVQDADQAVPIGPPEASSSYLDIDKIIQAALRTGAQAIHPGYGFLAENAGFARACADAGITFIGPSPEAIAVMGSKLESKALMREAGVPTLPSIEFTADVDLAAAADEIGYPVLVKASAGGGGKGMRIVREAEGLAAAVEGAIREAESSFGDGTVFLEKYLEDPRHIEIQVFGDTHGTVVHLFERE